MLTHRVGLQAFSLRQLRRPRRLVLRQGRRPRASRPNGAGKTTLMQMIATITKPTAGRIFFRDVDIVAQARRAPPPPRLSAAGLRRLRQPHRARVPQLLRRAQGRALASAKCSEMLEMVNLHSVGQPRRRRILRRHEAAPRHRPGADQRSRSRHRRRADRRPRSRGARAVSQRAGGARRWEAGHPLHAHRLRRRVDRHADRHHERRLAGRPGYARGARCARACTTSLEAAFLHVINNVAPAQNVGSAVA